MQNQGVILNKPGPTTLTGFYHGPLHYTELLLYRIYDSSVSPAVFGNMLDYFDGQFDIVSLCDRLNRMLAALGHELDTLKRLPIAEIQNLQLLLGYGHIASMAYYIPYALLVEQKKLTTVLTENDRGITLANVIYLSVLVMGLGLVSNPMAQAALVTLLLMRPVLNKFALISLGKTARPDHMLWSGVKATLMTALVVTNTLFPGIYPGAILSAVFAWRMFIFSVDNVWARYQEFCENNHIEAWPLGWMRQAAQASST